MHCTGHATTAHAYGLTVPQNTTLPRGQHIACLQGGIQHSHMQNLTMLPRVQATSSCSHAHARVTVAQRNQPTSAKITQKCMPAKRNCKDHTAPSHSTERSPTERTAPGCKSTCRAHAPRRHDQDHTARSFTTAHARSCPFKTWPRKAPTMQGKQALAPCPIGRGSSPASFQA
jgi:hypothetical protein